jgi:hypothetical protein
MCGLMKSALLTPLVLLAMAVSLRAQNAPLAPLPDDGFVRLEQIVSDFHANPAAAEQKYHGQHLKVYGRVGEIRSGTGEAGHPLIVFLRLPGVKSPDVKCKFTADAFPNGVGVNIADDGSQASLYRHNGSGNDVDMGAFVSKDQNVGISGAVRNYFAGDLVLTDCKKIKSDKLHALLKAHNVQ